MHCAEDHLPGSRADGKRRLRASRLPATCCFLPRSLQVSVLAEEGLHDEMMARVAEAMASVPTLERMPPPQGQPLAPGMASTAPRTGADWATSALEHVVLDTAVANIALRALASEGKVCSLSLPGSPLSSAAGIPVE